MILDHPFHLHHFFVARNDCLIAYFAIAPCLNFAFDEEIQPLDAQADFFSELDPRQTAEYAESPRANRQQQHRTTEESQTTLGNIGEQAANDATGTIRQRALERIQAHRFKRAGGNEQNEKTSERNNKIASIKNAPCFDATEQSHHREPGQRHPPPRGKPKQPEQEIGKPCSGRAAFVQHWSAAAAEKIAGIAGVVRGKNQHQIKREC